LLGRKQTIHRYTPRSAFDPTETLHRAPQPSVSDYLI
jgi:hypothetical protein